MEHLDSTEQWLNTTGLELIMQQTALPLKCYS